RVELSAAREELVTVSHQLETHQKKVRDLGESFANSERERIELSRRFAEDKVTIELQDLREKISSAQGQVKDSQSMLQTIRGERDAVRRQLTDRNEKLTQISETLDAAKAEFDRTKQEAAEAVSERDRLTRELSEHQEETKDLQSRVDNLLDNLHAREHALAEAQAKHKVSADPASTSGPRREPRAAHLATARAAAEPSTKERDEARGELKQARTDLGDLTRKLDTLGKELSAPHKVHPSVSHE